MKINFLSGSIPDLECTSFIVKEDGVVFMKDSEPIDMSEYGTIQFHEINSVVIDHMVIWID